MILINKKGVNYGYYILMFHHRYRIFNNCADPVNLRHIKERIRNDNILCDRHGLNT